MIGCDCGMINPQPRAARQTVKEEHVGMSQSKSGVYKAEMGDYQREVSCCVYVRPSGQTSGKLFYIHHS